MEKVYCRYTDAVFSPAEVGQMSGVSPELQRTWRKRGILGAQRYGRGQIAAREIAQIFLLRFLGRDHNIELESVGRATERAAPLILWFALGESQAMHLNIWDIRGSSDQQRAFKKALAEVDLIGLQYLDKVVGVKEDDLARFLVLFSNSQFRLESNLLDLFGDARPVGTVIDLMALGKKLAKTVKKPLIIVDDIEVRS